MASIIEFIRDPNVQYKTGRVINGIGMVTGVLATIPVAILLFDTMRFVVTGNTNFSLVCKCLQQINSDILFLRIVLGWVLLVLGSVLLSDCGNSPRRALITRQARQVRWRQGA